MVAYSKTGTRKGAISLANVIFQQPSLSSQSASATPHKAETRESKEHSNSSCFPVVASFAARISATCSVIKALRVAKPHGRRIDIATSEQELSSFASFSHS